MDAWNGSFAQNQLEKFGWNKGDGLGKNKDGNVKHISVTKKNDKKGVGVGQDQWEFAWWDHLFNKSASGVVINKDDDKGEVKVETKNHNMRKSKTGIISTVKPSGISESESSPSETPSGASTPVLEEQPRTMMDSVKVVHQSFAQRIASSKLYGAFVKSTTGALDPSAPNSEQASKETSANASDADSDNEFKDYSVRITDAELFAACEGRTARKGGRGLVDQKGKFARVMTEYLANSADEPALPSNVEESSKDKKRKKSDEKDDTKPKKKKAKRDDADKESKKKLKKSSKEKKSKKDSDEKTKSKKDKQKGDAVAASKTEKIESKDEMAKSKTAKKEKKAKKEKSKKQDKDSKVSKKRSVEDVADSEIKVKSKKSKKSKKD
ncbi:hypothetical protein K450DRAFT_229859 [Umbelopsis ramanniana AG]|uniref:G-patch domain-containing protein n=1 Tax=Umbelopsis ramanniana AG TaxID=1314678 RepID=A0AAD5HGA4_UMBRA|nr:uncharacterized protein K450DRAFT_229859 [Umbelopsis ramanniana AG]KAI8581909.1 hypothetical protein K450DRAFT_229859 [Umbelopsis ramanniana AG]